MNVDADSPRVKLPPPLAFLGTLLAGLLLGRLLGRPGLPLYHSLEDLLGWIGLLGGLAIIFTAIGLFRKAGTNPEPWKPAHAIVTDGVYRWTRNPMYLGMSLAYLGIALLCDSLITLLLFVPLFVYVTREVIEREEAYLAAKFGDEYGAYRARVRRWF